MARTSRVEAVGTLELGDQEVDVVVTGTFRPATPDVYYLSNGDPGYPGDPAEVEVGSVVRADTRESVEALLTDEQRFTIDEWLRERGSEAESDGYADHMERLMDEDRESRDAD